MEKCPSCNAPVSINGKFCTECGYNYVQAGNASNTGNPPNKPYRLRSPIFESSILTDEKPTKTYSLLVTTAYTFWVFAVIFAIVGIKNFANQYTVDFYKSLADSAIILLVALICFIIPGLVNLIISIDKNLETILKKLKRDTQD